MRVTKKVSLSACIAICLEQILRALDLTGFHIECQLVDDHSIAALNRKHRRKRRPTDVLSFPLFAAHNGRVEIPSWLRSTALRRGKGGAESALLGSVVISRDTARLQAKEVGHCYRAEVIRLLVHGVCHVVGYDHERSPAEEKLMFAEEDRIVALLKRRRLF